MSEYIFVHLLDKRPVGCNVGRSMPLHMTVLHWFESNREQPEIISEAHIALSAFSRMAIRGAEKALFGPNEDIPVTRLDKTENLISLHNSLLTAMQDLGATFNMAWSGENWNPHVSDKPGRNLSVGDEVMMNDIDLAVRAERYGARTLLHRFEI